MKPTIELLRTVGSPFTAGVRPPEDSRIISDLYSYARNNRMPLFFLSALEKWEMLGGFKEIYDGMYQRSSATYGAMSKVSEILSKANVPHALFKTVRPYRETTVDIDVLIFGFRAEHEKAVRTMIDAGYIKLGAGPNSTTVKDPSFDIGVDLYREIAVSEIIYLDKNKIGSYITEAKILPNNRTVITLSPSADLVALIAHSIVKEHMYTLSEYYSTLLFLSQMSKNDLDNLVEIVQNNAVMNAARVHIGITAKLHEAAHGYVPDKVESVLSEIGVDALETQRVGDFYTPHKFHPITVVKALLEKMRSEEKTRRSVTRQIRSMLDPSFTGPLMREIIAHSVRVTY